MTHERSTLQVDPDFNARALRVDQRPLLAWAALTHINTLMMLCGMAAFTLVSMMPWGLHLLVGAVVFFLFSHHWRRPARFGLGPSRLEVDAWTGRVARPRVHRLALAGLQIEWVPSGKKETGATHNLVLRPPGEAPVRVGALACTEADLERLRTEIAAAQADAVARIGAGVDEIPAELHAVRGDVPIERG